MGRTLQTISATVMGIQLTYPVLAHSGELHGQPAAPAETSAPDNADDSALESETPASSTQIDATDVTTEDALTSEPPPLASVPDGLGESLFTILVGFPWLLIVLRMQLHTSHRS